MPDYTSQGDHSAYLNLAPHPMGPAAYDPASGALTLAAFDSECASIITSDVQVPLAIWFIDIRNFRSINPQYGFGAGNMVLRILVSSMHEQLCHDMPISRLGGDRFIALSSCVHPDNLQEAFDGLVERFNELLSREGIRQHVALYAGVYYLRPEDRTSANYSQYLDYASIAHRNARRRPVPGVVQFSDEDLERDRRRIAIERGFEQAMDAGDIQVWYQPQIDYIYGEVVGAEALARWHHPELGWIGADEFIPVLEACGKIYQLDSYIWEEACRCASRWRSASDGKPVPISVNLAWLDLLEPQIIQRFLDLRKDYELPEGSIRLEIAENAFTNNPAYTYGVVRNMRSHMLTIEVDSFGNGNVSFDMFNDAHVDAVKLDMGFLHKSTGGIRNGAVLSSIVRMLQGLDMPIIAKNVETVEQAEMLKNLGCHLMQGYLFSRPLPVKDFEKFVASNRAEEHGARRRRKDTQLDRLFDIDPASSYLFNKASGAALYFFVGEGACETMLVNDEFYEACGLDREAFADRKIDFVSEIDEESRKSFWRAVAESRDHAAALCRATVCASGANITGAMRRMGESTRGDVYLLNIVRNSSTAKEEHRLAQTVQKLEWDLDLLKHIVPSGFAKCDLSDMLSFAYIDQELLDKSGLTSEEIGQHFHNSLIEMLMPEDRRPLLDAVRRSRKTGQAFSCDVRVLSGHGLGYYAIHLLGRVDKDSQGVSWLYLLVESAANAVSTQTSTALPSSQDVIVLEYHFADDRLVIHPRPSDVEGSDLVLEDYIHRIEEEPAGITPPSAARVISLVRDLRHHPTSGFFDVRCTFVPGEDLEWHHINYTCDSDEEGNALVMRGYVQGANDQMGSARWWREQAETDQLTGLLNRNAAELAINLSMRTQGRGMMFMIDMDSFKSVNDRLGHLAGDTLLREVATALGTKFRAGDVLGRYGGDEFIAFMAVSSGSLMELAERRARAIVEAISDIDVGDGTHAACSVGVALCTNRDATFYDLLEVADDAMYESKERGKCTYTILSVDEEALA